MGVAAHSGWDSVPRLVLDWLGLPVTMSAVAVSRPIRAGFIAVSLAVLANALYRSPPSPESWEGVYTTFDRITHPVDPLPEYRVAERIQQISLASISRVIVFPETMILQWTEATEAFWRPTLADVRARGKTLLIGVGLPIRAPPTTRTQCSAWARTLQPRFCNAFQCR